MKRLFLAAALAAAMLVPSQALASSHNPTGEFAQFGECPLSNPALAACVFSESSGGFFTVGTQTVPLVNPVILQGGLTPDESKESGLAFVGAENGETLSKTPQPVPIEILGTKVTATVELAAPASAVEINLAHLLFETGTALSLPVKIKLSNVLLGNHCYVGSNFHPIVIDFTTGETSPPPPNEPIHGSAGTFETNEDETLITLSGGSLVNNSFAAPKAHGCGGLLFLVIDPIVNSILGLPAPAGTNTAVLEGVLKSADANAVRESEE